MNTKMMLSLLVRFGMGAGMVLGIPMVTAAPAELYADFPVTVSAYQGEATSSVSYTGQTARHLLHNSLKALANQGDGSPNATLKALLLSYYAGTDGKRKIVSPDNTAAFPIKQAYIDDISTKKNLADKAYKGIVTGWPGNLTGEEVLTFLLDKASSSKGGYDPLTGYDYVQLLSKFAMGAVFYHQAVDHYLDESLSADKKPNNLPYKQGAAYTGKEHVWDEAFGYFGAPAHTLTLHANDVVAIAKQKPEAFAKADANGDGVVDLNTEMAYAYAYYAAGFDASGKTRYLQTITQAFIDGRALIAGAKGNKLSEQQRQQLVSYADVIADNWEKVIAEAIFKYAGKVYKDLQKLNAVVADNGDASTIFRDYAKHWAELKGFALAIQMGKKNPGDTMVKLNRLIGFSPVLLGNTQVSGVDNNGHYIQTASESLDAYRLQLIKVQKLMLDQFSVKARSQDVLASLGALSEKLKTGHSAEND